MSSMDIDQSLDDIIASNKSTNKGRGQGRGQPRGRGGRASRGRGGGGRGAGRSTRANVQKGAGAKALKAALAASLDSTRGRGRGRGRGNARGRGRGRAGKVAQTNEIPAGRWKHDMYSGPRVRRGTNGNTRARGTTNGVLRSLAAAEPKLVNLKTKKKNVALTTGTVIRVSNLDDNVTASDMKELFESEGQLKKVVMTQTHCDVTFQKKEDAIAAIQKFNGVTLDGEQMKIKLLTSLAR